MLYSYTKVIIGCDSRTAETIASAIRRADGKVSEIARQLGVEVEYEHLYTGTVIGCVSVDGGRISFEIESMTDEPPVRMFSSPVFRAMCPDMKVSWIFNNQERRQITVHEEEDGLFPETCLAAWWDTGGCEHRRICTSDDQAVEEWKAVNAESSAHTLNEAMAEMNEWNRRNPGTMFIVRPVIRD